ncbi:hypothetical protein GOBAR_AA07808 [Gossypium barbadense]|uniref:Uncharacterized protein n=1 Tax=Gossypium barbadense TaxID=3634 RepID=A0A2P5YB64_GOSBA|nr:hypothetical protein GOBAR_AA07808 [Gossypium barbadense]
MVSLSRVLAVSYTIKPSIPCNTFSLSSRFPQTKPKLNSKWRSMATEPDSSSFAPSIDSDSSADKATAGFCIIEGPETVQDFANMELQEIQDNIRSRRNKVFLQMEEVRRLRIQQRIKSAELGVLKEEREIELPNFPSFIPFLPPLTSANLKVYYATCYSLIAGIILFGGLIAPTVRNDNVHLVILMQEIFLVAIWGWTLSLELKLGLGGTSYADFISSMHLPMQLRYGNPLVFALVSVKHTLDGVEKDDRCSCQVDPIVASFSGGAVGVISALMVVEINNVKQQEHKRCKYCLGTGYLACARCSNTGSLVLIEPVSTGNGGDRPLSTPKTERCSNCSGSGKVMCPTCLCTGMAMASEHDPRIDPFD